MNVHIWSVAEQELAAAALWYQGQQSGLGNQFLDQYEAAMTAVENDAASFPILESLTVDRPAASGRAAGSGSCPQGLVA